MPELIRRKPGKSLPRYHAHLAGRAAIAFLLEEAGLEYFVVPDREFGFLTLRNKAGLASTYCNVTHTESIAVAAISDRPIGIDIESAARDAIRVFPRVLTDEELSWAHTLPSSYIWSAKEAFSKALGLGMKFGFKALELDLKAKDPRPCKTSLKGPLSLKDPAIAYLEHEGFVISVCSEKELLKEKPALKTFHLG